MITLEHIERYLVVTGQLPSAKYAGTEEDGKKEQDRRRASFRSCGGQTGGEEAILEALARAGGNKSRAASLLGSIPQDVI